MIAPSRLSLVLLTVIATACAPRTAPVHGGTSPHPPTIAEEEVPPPEALPSMDTPLPFDPRVRTGKLDNGLTWFVEPNTRPEARAEIRLVVKAGSILETDAQRGLAHFVEHMAFNGSEHFEGNDLVAYLELVGTRFGSHINAFTSFDETVYQLQIPTDDPSVIDTAFLVLDDWASGLLFDPEECEKERGVVLEEWRLGQGLGQRMQDRSIPLTFHGSRYADRLPIGTPENLSSFDCAEAERFWETWYRPELMGVLVVGDVDVDDTVALIDKHLGDLENPKGAPERTYAPLPEHELLVDVSTDPELPQSVLTILEKHPMVEQNTHGAYYEFLLENIAYNLLNERLIVSTQEPDAPYHAIQTTESELAWQTAGQVVQVLPKDGRELEALERALVEIERFHRFGVTEAELERARRTFRNFIQEYYDERHKTDSTTHVEEQLRHFLTDEPMPGIPYEYAMAVAWLPKVTKAEMNGWLDRHWMTGRSRVITLAMPERADLEPPEASRIRALITEVGAQVIAAPAEEAVDQPLMETLPEPGTATFVAEDAALGTRTWRLSNGATVILKDTDLQADQIVLEAVSPGGTSLIADEDYIAGITAVGLTKRSGVGDFTAVQVAKAMAGRDAFVTPWLGDSHEGFSGGASKADLERMLQLLHLYVTQPRFDETAFRLEQDARRESVASSMVSPDARVEAAVRELEWQGNPRYTAWTLEDVEQMDLDTSARIYRERFRSIGDFTFVLVGNLDEAAVVPLLERYVASLPAGETESWVDLGARRVAGQHEVVLERGDTPRAEVRWTFPGDFETGWQERLLLDAAEGAIETILFEEIREERGGTYGVRVDVRQRPLIGRVAVEVSFECDPDRVDELVEATWEGLREARERMPGELGLVATREKNRRSHETDLQSNDWWAAQITGAILRGEDPAALLTYDERNDALQPEAVHEVVRQILDLDEYVFVKALPR